MDSVPGIHGPCVKDLLKPAARLLEVENPECCGIENPECCGIENPECCGIVFFSVLCCGVTFLSVVQISPPRMK